jgi:3-oxoacyl-[acyl-carrier-protein] synthase III
MMEAGHRETTQHAMRTLIKNRWTPEQVDFLIMHQASSVAVAQTRSAINRFLDKAIATTENVIDNIQHRGNTATTTHWIAVQDLILNGKMKRDNNLLLYISGSGLNIGTALYVFDDLPERIARYWETGEPAPKQTPRAASTRHTSSISIEIVTSAMVYPAAGDPRRSAIAWATEAAAACLQDAADFNIDRSQVGLVCYTGVHRDEQIFEPAIAAIISGNLSINAYNNQPDTQPRTISFDIFNSDLGFLQACYTAGQVMAAGRCQYALVSTSEMENNAINEAAPLLGTGEGGAAWLLRATPNGNSGFGSFLFRTCEGLATAVQTWVEWPQGHPVVCQEQQQAYMQALLAPIQQLVQDLLQAEGLEAADMDYLVPPFTDPGFIAQLLAGLCLPNVLTPVASGREKGVLTLPCLMEELVWQETPLNGRKALLISAGAGGQIGAAVYFF